MLLLLLLRRVLLLLVMQLMAHLLKLLKLLRILHPLLIHCHVPSSSLHVLIVRRRQQHPFMRHHPLFQPAALPVTRVHQPAALPVTRVHQPAALPVAHAYLLLLTQVLVAVAHPMPSHLLPLTLSHHHVTT